MIITCAPFAISVSVQYGLYLVFGRHEIIKHHFLFLSDDFLLQNLATFVGELHNNLFHTFRRYDSDVNIAVLIIVEDMKIYLDWIVGSTSYAEEY